MDYSSERSSGCRIKEYHHNDMRTLSMENEFVSITILLDKGADIFEIIYKPKDIDFLWKTPGGIKVPGQYVTSVNTSQGNFTDYYAGGWQEIFPGGGPARYKGAEWGLHGEAALLPWEFQVLNDSIEEIRVNLQCCINRFPFTINKTITLVSGESTLFFEESLRNEGNEPMEFMWGQHPAFSVPFITSGAKIKTTARKYIAWGRDIFPTSNYSPLQSGEWPLGCDENQRETDLQAIGFEDEPKEELLFLTDFSDGMYEISNPNIEVGAGFYWDKDVFPYLWYWRMNKMYGYPWYGRSQVAALEPFTSYPNNFIDAQENGSLKILKAKEILRTSYRFNIFAM